MCGVVAYVGSKAAGSNLLAGLKALEYRGYDSAGIAVVSSDRLLVAKQAGSVDGLAANLPKALDDNYHLGIGHTRWATHGRATKANAHPHLSGSGRIALVHNGIIENYQKIKTYLEAKGFKFKSQTDTEAIAHLIEFCLSRQPDFEIALLQTLRLLRGTYGLAIIDKQQPNQVWAAKMSSPLIIGLGDGQNLLASDAAALLDKTRRVIYLRDGEVAKITAQQVTISDLSRRQVTAELAELEGDLTQVKKGHYQHFMLKEIFEAPDVIRASSQGRLQADGSLKLGGLESVRHLLRDVKRLIIIGCGSSYYAGLIAEYWLEELSSITVEVQLASEFRYRKQTLAKDTLVLAISQSGETADTLAAVKQAKKHGLLTIGIVNVVGSSIARETEAGVYNHAGPEIGVASTKAFLSQLLVLMMISLYLSPDSATKTSLIKQLLALPAKMDKVLAGSAKVARVAKDFSRYQSCLFVGRGIAYPLAMEGALKLKEVSYLHAEGFAAGELKHGPIALVTPKVATVGLVTKDRLYQKTISNLEEVKARRGPILAIASLGDKTIKKLTPQVIYLPKTADMLQPFLTSLPLQLLAYYVGVGRGHNVDKPRNLAKSVTVE